MGRRTGSESQKGIPNQYEAPCLGLPRAQNGKSTDFCHDILQPWPAAPSTWLAGGEGVHTIDV